MGTNLGKLNRSVSIIGVGCTPFGSVLERPEVKGFTESELFAWAAIDALADAGIESKDVDAIFHGQVLSSTFADVMCPNVYVEDWIGMRGKPCYHLEQACATGYIILDAAAMAVASGKYDVVLAGGVEIYSSAVLPNKPAHLRRPIPPDGYGFVARALEEPGYARFYGKAGLSLLIDSGPSHYVRDYGLSKEQIDDVLLATTISARRNAARNPLACLQTEFKDIAKENGFDDVTTYMKSGFNPKITQYLRMNGFSKNTDGAAALIVCPTEMAESFKQQAIEVLGVGVSVMEMRHPCNETKMTAEAMRQAYQLTGVTPQEIDLFLTQDLFIGEQLESAELAGYLPRGKGWQVMLEGQTAFDGDKPINTSGGRTSFGHAYGASGCADYYEAVKQMRGQCGPRQVKKLPETAMVRGMGGGQHAVVSILRTVQ